MPTLRELESWYTTAQAAHAAGRSRQGVINLAKDGKIRATQVGRAHAHIAGKPSWIFDPESIKKFVEAEREAQRQQHRQEREQQESS